MVGVACQRSECQPEKDVGRFILLGDLIPNAYIYSYTHIFVFLYLCKELGGQREALALDDPELAIVPREIDIEKVCIQGSLHNARHDRYPVVEVRFGKVSVYPVENVQGAVAAEGKEVVRRDGFGFACFGELVQLREDRDGFEVDGE